MGQRTFVIGDIHGGYKALLQVLDRAAISSEDKLIFLGDYVDGWSESAQVIDKLIDLKETNPCIFLRGNHDALLENWFKDQTENKLWLRSGGQSTIASYQHLSKAKIKEHISFLKSLENYYIDTENRFFVHGGFSKLSGPLNEYFDFNFYWDRTLWETAVATDKSLTPDNPRYPERFTHFPEMYIGHTPVLHLGTTKPHNALNVWNIDTGAGFQGPLSMLEIHTKEVFQSDPVHLLYPDEKGRIKK